MTARVALVAVLVAAACGGRSNAPGTAGNGGAGGLSGEGGSGGAAADAGEGGSGGQLIGRCPHGTRGPELVFVESSVRWYCIDGTEVSNEQYMEFLANAPPTSGQPLPCNANSSFEPALWPPDAIHPGDDWALSKPVRFVDWCDARAYCEWAGKRLCGSIGGGATPTAKYADATVSEWYAACSLFGELAHPYGNEYVEGLCRDKYDWPHPSLNQSPVNAVEYTCEGPMNGLHHLSGNVAEWEDSCDGTSSTAACRIRGGSYADGGAAALACDASRKLARGQNSAEVGFRCCADAE